MIYNLCVDIEVNKWADFHEVERHFKDALIDAAEDLDGSVIDWRFESV